MHGYSYTTAERRLTAAPRDVGAKAGIDRYKPCLKQPYVSDPQDDVFESTSSLEFTDTFQPPKAPSMSVEELLQLAEGRLKARTDNKILPVDLSFIPTQSFDMDTEPTDKLEVNLVKLIRGNTKDRITHPKAKLKLKSPKRLKIDLSSRTRR